MTTACTAGCSGLALAVKHRHEKVAEILLSHGANPDQSIDGEKLIVHSAVVGHAEMVRVLLSGNADPNCTTKDGLPLLFFLVALAAMKKKDLDAYKKMIDVITMLAQNACPCNVQGPGGFTPLHIAGEIGDENLIKELLLCGADRNAKTMDGKTAADIAAEWSHEKAVKYLRHGLEADNMQAASLAVDIKEFMQSVSSNAGSSPKNVPQPEQPDDKKYKTFKQAGNKAFVSGEYHQALELYKKALCHNTRDSKLWSDAAAAALRLCDFQDALKHARVSRTVDGKNIKAWYREGKAAEGLCLWEDAAAAYYEAFLITTEGTAGTSADTMDVDFALLVKEAVEKGREAFKREHPTNSRK